MGAAGHFRFPGEGSYHFMSLFYNYNKEGPGISKNGPRKKTFIVFFETLFRNIWKLIPTNFMYSLLFLIPFGFSAVGMTGVTRSISRGKHTFGLSDFFSTIRANLRQVFGVGFLNAVITVVLWYDLYFFWQYSKVSDFGFFGLGVALLLNLTYLIMKFYIWFIVITFDMSVRQIYRNSFKFVMVNLKNNVLILLSLLAYWAIWFGLIALMPTHLTMAFFSVFLIFFYPTYRYLAIQYGVFPSIKKYMIDPYYAEHPDADIENRRKLGLDVGDEDADFSDL